MEVKKSPKADLQKTKLLFTEIGLLVSIGIVLAAFEWKSTDKAENMFADDTKVEIEEEIIPVTTETPPPPPETAKIPVLSDQIDIVDDNIEVDDDLFVSLEDNANMGVEIMDYKTEVEEEVVEEEAIPFALVEDKPKFQGGDPNMFSKWIGEHLKYPEIARENGVSGRVILQFTIETDGSLTNVRVLRGVDSSLDKEALRVVSSSPKWTPGKQRDRAVRVSYNFPVVFQLR